MQGSWPHSVWLPIASRTTRTTTDLDLALLHSFADCVTVIINRAIYPGKTVFALSYTDGYRVYPVAVYGPAGLERIPVEGTYRENFHRLIYAVHPDGIDIRDKDGAIDLAKRWTRRHVDRLPLH